jgi:3-methyl-2-oxobutanoate hydroxymethyltransferase
MTANSARHVTAPGVVARKGDGNPLVMVTAYDAPSARTVDGAGVDLILVGDSVAMVVLGYDDTLQVTTDDMAHHVAAVARTRPGALVVADLPWLSYHVSTAETVHNAARLVRAGAGAVKLEGGRKRLDSVHAILDAEIPVMGHIGLTPQSVNVVGGFKLQGKYADDARHLIDEAVALDQVGCFSMVLECVPTELAAMITERVSAPTIGIGAGPSCDGQVLVFHDLLGLYDNLAPKFVRKYAEAGKEMRSAIEHFLEDVRNGSFPDANSESFHMSSADELKRLYGDSVVVPMPKKN